MDPVVPQTRPKARAEVDFGGDFLEERSKLSDDERARLDCIVEALTERPNRPADQEFMNTPVGVMRAHKNRGVYALYQLFSNEPPTPYRLKFWHCGRCTRLNGRDVFDFE